VFPTALNAVALDPGEYALYVGGADGRIFITALNYGVPTASGILNDGLVGSDAALIGHSRAVTALAFSMDGMSLVSGSEDCTVRLWDTASRQVLRTFTHSKGQPCFSVKCMTPSYNFHLKHLSLLATGRVTWGIDQHLLRLP
jgi:pre-rRNA-processing protein IPI3